MKYSFSSKKIIDLKKEDDNLPEMTNIKNILLGLLLFLCSTVSAQLEQIWKTEYPITSDTFQTFGYKTDGAGNFYLYGWQHNKVFLQKHNAEGQIEWTINDASIVAPLNVNGNIYSVSNSRITDIIFDSDVNLYVLGISSQFGFNNPNYSSYFFISKLTIDGQVLWIKNYSASFDKLGGTEWNYNAQIIYSSSESEIYVSYGRLYWPLSCNGQRNLDFGIIKYDTSGNILWNRTFIGNSTYCTKDIVTSLFFKDIILTFSGFSTSPYPNLGRLITVDLDRDGNLINRAEEKQFIADSYSDRWNNLYLTDTFTTKAQTKGNTTYITAESADSIATEKRNLLVLKYDETLNRIWRYDLEKDSSINLKIENSVVDDSCNLLVSGIWKEKGESKAFLVKLDSSGNERYRDTFATNLEVNLIFLNKNQESILINTSINGSTFNTSLRKYHPSGWLMWDTLLVTPGKILHAYLDSCYIYLVIQYDKTLTYIKLRDVTCKDDPFLTLYANSRTASSVTLGWSFNDTFPSRKGFVVERSLDGLYFNTIDSVHKDTSQYTNNNLSPNTLYHYRVGAYHDAGVYLVSNIINASTLLNTSNNQTHASLTIYPNPTTGLIYLQNMPEQTVSCSVYDITGRLLLEATQVEHSLNISALKQGIYILRISDTTNQSYVFKIIKE